MVATLTRETGPRTCHPRFSTPRDLSRRTLGPQIGEIARRLGQPLMPWQQLVADVAFELDEHGRFLYSQIVLTVPRQSGKTSFVMAKTIWRLVVYSKEHGPQTSTYVSQKRQSARKKFERSFAPLLRTPHTKRSFSEVKHNRMRPARNTEWRISLNNGSECIQFGDSYWQLEATSEDSGHGDTLDDSTIDEARFKLDDSAEAAMRPAMSTRTDPMITVVSTAGGPLSVYFYRKVIVGREACESGNHGKVAYFEWSAPEDADPGDPETWWGCMPALGHTVSEDFIRGEWEAAERDGPDAVETFRQEYLNIWTNPPVLDEEDAPWVLPKALWQGATNQTSKITGTSHFALAVADDRSWSCIAAAGESDLGGVQVGRVRYDEDTSWVVDQVKAITDTIVIAKGSQAVSLVGDLETAGIAVVQFTAEEQATAFARLQDTLTSGQLKHPPQADLDMALQHAELSQSDGGAYRLSPKRSTVDISPLVAVTLAVSKHLQPAVSTVSVYESRGLVEL